MNNWFVIIGLLIVAFILAIWSMRDLRSAGEVLKMINKGKIKGAIVFFKDKIVHLS